MNTCFLNIFSDNDNTHRRNIKEHNECFFIPSQVTLNESNIINQNLNKVK